jgi:hypothetical protein
MRREPPLLGHIDLAGGPMKAVVVFGVALVALEVREYGLIAPPACAEL